MPDPDEFVISYPCYFPLSDEGSRLITVTVDRLPAVVFLTDKALADRFGEEWSREHHGKPYKLIACDNPAMLLETARRVLVRTNAAGIKHVAVDPGGRFKCAYVAIKEFVEYVESLPTD
jgi:hypothetical protein